MWNDRDLGFLGAGAFCAVLCIILPISLIAKAILAVVVLVIFMVIALLRLGPDRVPLEVFIKRRIQFAVQARKYTYHGGKPASNTSASAPAAQAASRSARGTGPALSMPMTLAWEDVGVYWIVSAWLTVIAVYFVYWLANGGSKQMSFWLQHYIR